MTIRDLRTLFVAALQNLHVPSKAQPFADFDSWQVYHESEAFEGGADVYVVLPPKFFRESKLYDLRQKMEEYNPNHLGGHIESVRIPEYQPGSNRRRSAIVFDSI